MACFKFCCGFGAMESLEDLPDSKSFSPIISLDSYVADWAYPQFKSSYDVDRGCLSERFPKRKNVDITVSWSNVVFKYNKPVELDGQESSEENATVSATPTAAAATTECNGNESEEAELMPVANPEQVEPGFGRHDEMKSVHNESFSVMYENTTEKACEINLTSERRVKASYDVEVHESVQTGHSLKLTLQAGGDEGPGKIEGGYEFNKMLETYKGEKENKEMETTLHTECPVTVPANSITEARIMTKYAHFKNTFKVKTEFSGTFSIDLMSKKRRRNGKRYRCRLSNVSIGEVFEDVKKEDSNSPLAKMITISGTSPNEVITYTSSATFSTNYGVDQCVKLFNYKKGERPINI